MYIIDSKTALKLRPIMRFHMEVISKTMENPTQFLYHGYWIIELPEDFYTKRDELLNDLTDEEEEHMIAWLTSWLNSRGWDIKDNEKIIPYTPVANDTPATTGETQ